MDMEGSEFGLNEIVKEEDHEISETEDEKVNTLKNKIRRLAGTRKINTRARAVTIDVDDDN